MKKGKIFLKKEKNFLEKGKFLLLSSFQFGRNNASALLVSEMHKNRILSECDL